MLTAIKNKMRKKNIRFRGSEENYIRNGARVLEESISLFHGRTNYLLRNFSIDELNGMNLTEEDFYGFFGVPRVYQGCFDGRPVLIDTYYEYSSGGTTGLTERLHEIVVASEMGTRNNVHRLLGCCLETEYPVLIYEWVGAKSLKDQNKQLLEWKDRLRIAWEISHVVAYLHTAFPRPIIHLHLKPSNILLDENNSAKLRDFSLSISLPEGEEFGQADSIKGTFGYMAPEYMERGELSESTDVYSFGVILLVLLTGKEPHDMDFVKWVGNSVKDNIITGIVDPAIIRNGVTTLEDLQLRASIQLALLCCADSRPTMVEVATKLKNMITSPGSIPEISTFHVPFFVDTYQDDFDDRATCSDVDLDDRATYSDVDLEDPLMLLFCGGFNLQAKRED